MIYIFIFSLTGLLIYQSEYYEKKHKKILSDLIAIAAVLTISTFAGLRDISVGTDVEYYLVKHFNWASMFKGRMWEYVVYLTTFEEVEPIYAFVQYIGYHIFHKVNFVLFILSFITHTFIYFGIKKKENEISVSFGWIIYCFIYFNTSLNASIMCRSNTILYSYVLYPKRKICQKEFCINYSSNGIPSFNHFCDRNFIIINLVIFGKKQHIKACIKGGYLYIPIYIKIFLCNYC